MTARKAQPAEPDTQTLAWLTALRGHDEARLEAIARLHELLLRAARFEVSRRRPAVTRVRADELDDLALQAADGALITILTKLSEFDGPRCFTTWVSKFALVEVGVRLRCRVWQDRDVVLESDGWNALTEEAQQPDTTAEHRELLAVIRDCLAHELTPHQRQVVVALAIDRVPIDVLAERMATTRGALYIALHEGRRQLRARLAEMNCHPIP